MYTTQIRLMLSLKILPEGLYICECNRIQNGDSSLCPGNYLPQLGSVNLAGISA